MRPRLPEPLRTRNFVAVPFRVPEPGVPLQAYFAVSKIAGRGSGPYSVGQRVERRSGFVAGNEPSTAFWEHHRWPFHLYEITVDPRDVVIGQGELLLKTTAFRVVRELAMEELLGPRAADVGVLFDELHAAPWLAPAQPVDLAAIQALVESFYACAGDHIRVRAAPVSIVRQWEAARAADQRATYGAASPDSWMAITHALREAAPDLAADDDATHFTTSALRRMMIQQHFARAWDAGWQAGYASALRESMKAVRPGDAKGAKRAWTKLREEMTDRRDSARRAATHAARRMLIGMDTAEELPEQDDDSPKARRAIIDQMVDRGGASAVSFDAWNFALPVIATAMDLMDAALDGAERSAFRPFVRPVSHGGLAARSRRTHVRCLRPGPHVARADTTPQTRIASHPVGVDWLPTQEAPQRPGGHQGFDVTHRRENDPTSPSGRHPGERGEGVWCAGEAEFGAVETSSSFAARTASPGSRFADPFQRDPHRGVGASSSSDSVGSGPRRLDDPRPDAPASASPSPPASLAGAAGAAGAACAAEADAGVGAGGGSGLGGT